MREGRRASAGRTGFTGGTQGRFEPPFLPFFWGIWELQQEPSAAKSLLAYLSQASSARRW